MTTRIGKFLAVAFLALGLMLAAPLNEARADVGMAGDLGIGGDILLGGTHRGTFAFGITPYISYHPIDNLAIFGRLPFWEGYFDTVDTHMFPFLFGARYYFTLPVDGLRAFAGGALGFSIAHTSLTVFGVTASSTDVNFSLDFHGGVEYEVIDNLGISGTFDIYLPNVDANTTARFGVLAGVVYYLPI